MKRCIGISKVTDHDTSQDKVAITVPSSNLWNNYDNYVNGRLRPVFVHIRSYPVVYHTDCSLRAGRHRFSLYFVCRSKKWVSIAGRIKTKPKHILKFLEMKRNCHDFDNSI